MTAASLAARLEPIVLKNLPIILSRTSQKFTHYSYFIPKLSPSYYFAILSQ